MIIASWNVNSIKARLEHAQRWLKDTLVDVLLLQELKCETAAFPADAFRELGFVHQEVVGEKTYNGVAFLSKTPISNPIHALPGEDTFGHARFVGGLVNGVWVYGLYLPNGNPVDGPKYPYKLAWLERLRDFAANELKREAPVVFGGDFNVIPTAFDAKTPKAWEGDALFLPASRAGLAKVIHSGYADAFRALHPQEAEYTFWDYRAGAFPKNDGIRIDHMLLSPEAMDRCRTCWVDTAPRGWESPSDHTPILIQLSK